ncbi:hypothetical protein PDL71_05705 [Lacibacter sp. MH-610]|uniref:hypothetical protein n=1 Tax=Lacibacter sp. MH-610 TaxID=3020883 RepID=UPI003892572B
MKQLLQGLLTLTLLCVLFWHCNSPKKLSGPFKAKLVATLCGQHIVQIEDPKFYKLGINWKEYQHVFAVANHCDFVKAGLKAGDTFTCTIVEKAEEENCIMCEAFMETPEMKRYVKVVK